MLRITLSRLKKVCSDAFLPRILGGEHCGTPVCYPALRKAPKRAKSTDDGKQDKTDKKPDAIDYTSAPGTELKLEDCFIKKGDETAGLADKIPKERSQPIISGLPLTSREKCQRIIEKAFGKSDNTETDPVMSEQYFSHTINLEHTRHEIHEAEKAKLKLQEAIHNVVNPILPDDRTQYGIFKMSRELIRDDNQEEMKDSTLKTPTKVEGSEINPEKTSNIVMTSAKEPDLTKNIENAKGTAEETLPIKESSLTDAKEEAEKCVNNQESVENKACCDEDPETIEMVKDERRIDLYEKGLPTFEPDAPQVIRATTAKENEEQLIQKLEIIEETPLVEAQKPKIEGFNVTPRVLGDQAKLSCKSMETNEDGSHRVDLSFDEVAKRCMNSPLKQIDEMLLNEMENVGITNTGNTENKAPSAALMENDLVQMDVLTNEPNTPTDKPEISSDSPECEDKEEEPTGSGHLIISGSLSALHHISREIRLPDFNVQVEDIAIGKSEAMVKPTEVEDSNTLYPDHIRIQLEPLVTLTCDSEEYKSTDGCNTTKFACYFLPATHRAIEMNDYEIEIASPLKEAETNKAEVNEIEKLVEDSREITSNVTPTAPLSETLQTVAPFGLESPNEKALSKEDQCAPAAAELDNTSAKDNNTEVTSLDPPKDATDNIGHVKLLKPEYISYFKGVQRPSYYETLEASNSASNKQQTLADTNSFYARNLSAAYAWGHQQQKASASIKKHAQLEEGGVTDEIELQGQTPMSSTNEEIEKEQSQLMANSVSERIPYTSLHLPENNTKCTTEDKLLYSVESQPKSEQISGTASLPEELLKQHELDPYYVLTCNETCPISPGSTMSAYENSDFVDTTETIYMKKNICESLRPKPKDLIMNCEAAPSKTLTQLDEEDIQSKPEIMPEKTSADAIEIPPSPGEQVALTELLRRVRKLSRLECKDEAVGLAVTPAEGKCGRRAPRCPPTAPRSPPLNPVPPPSFGLPMLKRRPPVCKPKRKPGSSSKCTACDMNVSCGVQLGLNGQEMTYELNEAEICAVNSKVDLTEVVINNLQALGNVLGGVLRQVKSNIETLLARDYTPWSPIPSWPVPQKVDKMKAQPGKHGVPPCVTGCPISPKARASMNPEPPCNLKPCEGFPKRASFTMLDCFAVSLGENKVYDLGEF